MLYTCTYRPTISQLGHKLDEGRCHDGGRSQGEGGGMDLTGSSMETPNDSVARNETATLEYSVVHKTHTVY